MTKRRPRILVIVRGHIGDLIQAAPALHALRAHYPSAHVTALVNEYASGLLDGCPYVDDVLHGFAYEQRSRVQRIRDLLRLVVRVAGRFDTAVCLRFAPRHAPALALVAGARTRVGFDQPGIWGRLLTHNAGPQPELVNNRIIDLAPLRQLGVAGSPEYPGLDWGGPGVHNAADRLLERAGLDHFAGYAVVQVSCNWGCNELSSSKWAAIVDLLYERHGLRSAVIGVDDPFERAKFAEIAAIARCRPVSLHGQTSLPELLEVVRRSAVVVATDSALTQVALAQRVPAVVMFGIEPVVYNGPLPSDHERVAVIQHWEGPGRAPTPNRHCRFVGSYCHSEHCRENSSLEQTTVDEIMSNVAAVLPRTTDVQRAAPLSLVQVRR